MLEAEVPDAVELGRWREWISSALIATRTRVTLSGMRRLRTSTLKMGVIFLLAWTSLDLCLPRLCGAESMGFFQSAEDTGPDTLQTSHTAPARQAGQPDDCFCCSHSIDLRQLSLAGAPSGLLDMAALAVSTVPSALPTGLDHPPQL